MKKYSPQIAMALVCIVLGFVVTVQLKSVKINKSTDFVSGMRAEDLQVKLIEKNEENEELRRQIEKNLEDLKKYQDAASKDGESAKILKKQLDEMSIMSGRQALKGPGLIVTLNDSKLTKEQAGGGNENYFIIHDDDILKVINELNAAGAEAVSINDERLIAGSEIRCVGSTVSVNGNKYAAPFVIKAIGDGKTMESALNMRSGVIEILSAWGIEVDVKVSNNILIPAYKGSETFKYAKAAEVAQ